MRRTLGCILFALGGGELMVFLNIVTSSGAAAATMAIGLILIFLSTFEVSEKSTSTADLPPQ